MFSLAGGSRGKSGKDKEAFSSCMVVARQMLIAEDACGF